MQNYKEILVEKRGAIAIVKFNRPERMNAFTYLLDAEMKDAFAKLDEDDGVRCIVVTGKGKAFCAGAELNTSGPTFGSSKRDGDLELIEEKKLMNYYSFDVRKPIVAAINGHAVGAGLTMTLQFDIRIVAEDAKLGFVFVRRGIIPEYGSTWILPRMIGMSKATELLLTGRLFSGLEAVEMGLATRAVPKEKVLETAISLAEEIAVNCAPMSVALTKRLLWANLSQPNFVEAEDTETFYFYWIGSQSDANEGIKSFMEKRKPSWSLHPSRDFPPDTPSLI